MSAVKKSPSRQLSRQESQKRPSDMKRFSIHDTSGAAFEEPGDTKWGFDSEVRKVFVFAVCWWARGEGV